jgi:hypothetical protein
VVLAGQNGGAAFKVDERFHDVCSKPGVDDAGCQAWYAQLNLSQVAMLNPWTASLRAAWLQSSGQYATGQLQCSR